MKRSLQSLLLVLLTVGSPSWITAQQQAYGVLSTDVPFAFHIGNSSFRRGHYEFVSVGTGLVSVRDA